MGIYITCYNNNNYNSIFFLNMCFGNPVCLVSRRIHITDYPLFAGKYSSHENPCPTNQHQHIPAQQTSSNNGVHAMPSSLDSSITTIITNPLSNGGYDHSNNDLAAPEAPLIPASSRKAHKMRKKLKSKASRKHHHHQSLDNGGTDRMADSEFD